MDAVTYPDERVIETMQQLVIPVRVLAKTQPLATEYEVHWTPTLVWVDSERKEHHRTVGWLAPEDMVAQALLGKAKLRFDQRRLSEAISLFGRLLDEYPQSSVAPEALYLSGVARFKEVHDLKAMRAVYEKLKQNYPSSEWTTRASVYADV